MKICHQNTKTPSYIKEDIFGETWCLSALVAEIKINK